MSINNIKEKIKPHEKDLLLIVIILLVAFIGFGLGRLSKIGEHKIPVKVENLGASAVLTTQTTDQVTGALVGSKNGTKYHYPWCSGAQNIKEENKIWFDSIEDARKSGYTPASNCKGLE